MDDEKPRPIRSAIRDRLKEARNAAGMTGDQAGARLGYSAARGTISAWETGRGSPDLETFKRACDLYGCSADSVLWGKEEAAPGIAGRLGADIVQRMLSVSPADPRWAKLVAGIRHTLDQLDVPAVQPTKRTRVG